MVALSLVAVLMAGLAFTRPVAQVGSLLPVVGNIYWNRATLPMAFAVAILAGVGMDLLIRSPARRALWWWLAGGFAAAGLIVLGIWTFARGRLPPAEAAVHADSFVWPSIQIGVGLLMVGVLAGWSWHTHLRSTSDGKGMTTRRPFCWCGSAPLRGSLPHYLRRPARIVQPDLRDNDASSVSS